MLLDIATAGANVVVSGVFGNYYSNNNGLTFNQSKGEYGPSQSVRAFGSSSSSFGVAGAFLEKNGAAISTNSGKSFAVDSIPLYTEARYGAFPNANTWYVSAGEWPNNSQERSPLRKCQMQNDDGKFPSEFDLAAPETGNVEGNGYKAELVRTTDAGKTWTHVVAQNNSYYFNGIDCDPNDANHCCAVAEAFSIPNAGAHVFCTTNGVKWTQNFFQAQTNSSGYSLMDVRFSNSTYLWAVGAILGSVPNAWFLRSNDGGVTWAQASPTLFGLYAMSLSSPSADVSYASVDNTVLQKSGVAKYTAN
jgi:photosystem II stability/assembly factor-like uncharacterized protein